MPLDFTPAQEQALRDDMAARTMTPEQRAAAPKPTELAIDHHLAGKDLTRENMVEALREQGLHKDHAAFLANGDAPKFSKEAFDQATVNRKLFMADKEWQKRYLDGGIKERSDMIAVNIVLSTGYDAAAK